MLIDPRQEWRQIFDEAWRMEQQYFYDPKMHGLPWAAIRARYEPLLPFVQRREDLSELLVEMIGEMQVGHNRTGGGDVYSATPTGTGSIGRRLHGREQPISNSKDLSWRSVESVHRRAARDCRSRRRRRRCDTGDQRTSVGRIGEHFLAARRHGGQTGVL